MVNDGTYSSFYAPKGDDNFNINIKIKSVNGPYKTTIQGVEISFGYDRGKSSIEGFTIKGGNYSVSGGQVRRCIITGAKGVDLLSSCIAYNCIFYGNSISNHGGGMDSQFRETLVYNSTIYENHGQYIACDSLGTTFYNCIIYGNNKGRYVCANWGSYAYNCHEGNPLCVDLTKANFRLKATSPCISKGNNSYVSSSDKDILGNVRINDSKVDIGAVEYYPPIYTVGSISAVQRYPWNGVVDVKLSYSCSEAVGGQQTVTLEARDVVGGTNVTCKSFILDGVAKSTLSLSTGVNMFQWDTVKDLPVGFVSQLALSVTVGNTNKTSSSFKVDLRGLGPWERRTAAATESLSYSAAWATNAATGAKATMKAMPVLKQKPKYVVIALSGGTNATHYSVSYLDEVPTGGWSDAYKTAKLVLRHIPAGSFVMGGRNTDYPGAVNTNLHMVTITRDFYMGVFEVTQRQWELMMGNRPSSFTNETCYATRPVETISYRHIRGNDNGLKWPESKDVDDYSFLGLLRRRVGLSGFDLPTKAQWEYACRAGTKTALNSGKNLTVPNVTDIGVECVNANEIARYSGNNPYRGISQATNSKSDVSTAKATAAVGSYKGNAYGLFDMSGNVWELCLNAEEAIASGSVDPVGGELSVYRHLRGGSWCSSLIDLTSGDHHLWNGHGYDQVDKTSTVGFRLCLQGGDLPDLDAATTLVNKAGTGETAWSPTRAGTYYLTHATMNAGTNAQLLSAWFEVPGPRLVFTPLGELTNGVMVAIDGAEDGWTIRYTTDGSAPAADSPVYEGPFSLPASGMVRAVASNAQGLMSEEFSETFTLHDALSLVSATARPRYPWNGKVDVDVALKGDPSKTYRVALTAKDLDGGTNLPVKTVFREGETSEDLSAMGCVPPGVYRFTWDADADIKSDGMFPRVAVSVSATGSALVGYARQMALTVDGYTGAETLTDVPVLVRLSTAISGFDYNDFASPSNGADLAFFDANEQRLAYEIDEWRTNGTSLVWVKLPELKRGMRFTAAWGGVPMYGHTPDRSAPGGHEVWCDYAGVWRMNEDSGVAYDSTANGLDGIPSCGTNKLADVKQMVATENGACGRARVNMSTKPSSTEVMANGNYMLVPSYDALELGDRFVVSIWFKGEAIRNYPRLVSRKYDISDAGGFEYAVNNIGTSDIRGGTSVCTSQIALPDYSNQWVQVAIAFERDSVVCYTNGVEASSFVGVTAPPVDNGRPLAFGNKPNGVNPSFYGQYDEIRLRGGTLSADWIKADYDMIKNRDFLIYGPVKNGMGAAE